MSLNEADTRAKLIDPALYKRGWTEDQIKREETAGAIDVIGGKPRRRARGRIDYLLRVKINIDTQPVAMALIEATGEGLPPTHGLEQAKAYAESKRLNVAFVFSTNGHQFVEFDRLTKVTSAPRPIAEFPTPDELRIRYENQMGFSLAHPAAKPLLTRYQGGEATRRYYQARRCDPRSVREDRPLPGARRAATLLALACDRRGQDVHHRQSAATHRRLRPANQGAVYLRPR